MTTTEVVCCPLCRHAGDDGRPHGLQVSHAFWSCGRCGWKFVVEEDGKARHWLDITRAGRRRKRRRRR